MKTPEPRSTGDGQNLVTEDVTVVEGDVATISCRVKNSDDSVIQLLNPNRQTIYFRDFRRLLVVVVVLVCFIFNDFPCLLGKGVRCTMHIACLVTWSFPMACLFHSSEGQQVSVSEFLQQRAQSLSDQRLHFGRRKILLPTVHRPPQEYYMTITVLVPPRNLRIEYQKETAVEGEEIELNCTAMASRPATTIRWFKGSKPLPAGKAEVEQWSDMYTVTSQLSLKVKREDDGVPVVCQADHPAVKDMQAKYYLEVLFQVLQNSPGQPLTREGDLLDLLCQVKGKPEPVDVTWVRVDDEMPQHVIVSGSNLHIDSLNKSDNGTYRCEASNEVGTSFSDYTLYVYDNPTTLPPPTTTTTTTTTIPTTTTAADTTATTEPAVHGFTQLPNSAEELEPGDLSDSRAGEESAITAVDHAVIGGVVAVVVFAMLCLLIILGRYFARHKGIEPDRSHLLDIEPDRLHLLDVDRYLQHQLVVDPISKTDSPSSPNSNTGSISRPFSDTVLTPIPSSNF
ncbi:hypothetical protein JRQ81_010839 [Phrynocephalus forsythii]|uniref:Ig-like domain-containing protein n=1 Tax=Phrynocephalus forsythii TaxID=171643 RepID=A0A9Q0X774_9SAUR|nr:hypothetical protein JRQ81_010839 [Phrynocephalus forsythii]